VFFFAWGLHISVERHPCTRPGQLENGTTACHGEQGKVELGKIDETCEPSEVILSSFLTLPKSLSLPRSARKDGFMVSATDFTGD
jgi:hypothetical protein